MKAVIDLGTNTFNLLIGDVSKKEILVSVEMPVMLGKGGIQNKFITNEAIDRAFAVLQKFKLILEQYPVTHIDAFATSAIRNAVNGPDFKDQVFEKFGINIQSISGTLEASYIYEGVKNSFDLADENYLIMDIGGGSVELIIGNANESLWKKSFEIGAIRLHERFKKNDPILTEEIEAIENYLHEQLTDFFQVYSTYQIHGLIGSAGSFESMWQIIQNDLSLKTESLSTHAHAIHLEDVMRFLNLVIHSNLNQRIALKNLVEFRREYIVVACVLIRFMIQRTGIKNIVCSDYALKEGVFFTA